MPSDHLLKPSHARFGEESDLSLEVIILLIFGVFWLLFGLLLFKIYTGDLPYSPDSTYGLFLVIVSFQMITMGKTPFGDLRRSWALVLIGMGTALVGITVCFIPGFLTNFVRTLVGILLFAGGAVLFLQLFMSKKKAKIWMKVAGILRHLTIACAVVYAFTTISGIVTLYSGLRSDPRTSILAMSYGMSFFYLSWCVWQVRRIYGEEKPDKLGSSVPSSNRAESEGLFILFREATLPLSLAILILLGFVVTLLGLLLFPVSLGALPFSPDGQLGLTLTIMAIQVMAMGDTPIGQYRRSWYMIIIGLAFAVLGVISCIAPGILTGMVRILLGILNIISGSLFFIRQFFQKRHEIGAATAVPVVVHPIAKKLANTQLYLALITLAFGVSMLLPGLVSGFIVSGILIINGFLLFMLASLLQTLEKAQAS